MIALWLLLALGAPGAAPPAAPASTVSLDRLGPVAVGAPAPWFAGWTLDDTVINRTRVVDKAAKTQRGVALVFFATWCKPCVRGLDALAAARARLDAAGVTLLLVDFREEAATVRPFLAARGLGDAAVLLDKFGRAATAFGVSDGRSARLPRTVVLDAQGVVRGIFAAEGPDYVERVLGALGPTQPARRPGSP